MIGELHSNVLYLRSDGRLYVKLNEGFHVTVDKVNDKSGIITLGGTAETINPYEVVTIYKKGMEVKPNNPFADFFENEYTSSRSIFDSLRPAHVAWISIPVLAAIICFKLARVGVPTEYFMILPAILLFFGSALIDRNQKVYRNVVYGSVLGTAWVVLSYLFIQLSYYFGWLYRG
jgi:hypothetical protein